MRHHFVYAPLVLTLLAGCSGGPINARGFPHFENTNRAGLPGGEINTGGAPDLSKTNLGGGVGPNVMPASEKAAESPTDPNAKAKPETT